MTDDNKLAIYQNDQGAIELSVDADNETIWATQKQIALVFGVDVRTVNEHLMNIFKTQELDDDSVIRKFRITAKDGKTYNTKHYNLDAVISVGYRVNSKNATAFRKWATKTLKSYIVDGYAIDPARIEQNRTKFLQAMEDLKLLSKGNATAVGVADLSAHFAHTWFTLDAYDKDTLGNASSGTKKVIHLHASQLMNALQNLKQQLITANETTDLFAQPRERDGLESIFGNIFQTFDGDDVYPTLEEKAANLLYLVVKNHIFIDGNKRSGAFAFVWFLKEANILDTTQISTGALSAITLLVAQSDPKDKDKMVHLIKLLLGVDK